MYKSGKHVCTIWQKPQCAEVAPTANCFQRLRCVLRALVLPSEWHHGTALFIRSLKRLQSERDRHTRCYIWHPYSCIKYYWDCIQLIFIFTAFLYLPLQVFIDCPNKYDSFILFTDAMAFLNVCSQFVTGYVEHEHKIVVLDPQKIAIHYIKTDFIVDLFGCLPLQLIEPFSGCEYPSHTVMFVFKLLRSKSLTAQWRNVIGQLQLSYISYVAFKILAMIIMFFHWMTYIHYQVPLLCYHIYEKNDAFVSWLKRFHIMKTEQTSPSFQKYSTNFYLVCGLCIGAGYYTPLDTHFVPELLLSSSVGLVGLIFLTYAFSALLRLAIYRQYETYSFSGKSKQLEEYMMFMRLPKYLKRKIRLFINYKFNDHFFHEEAIKNTINEQIRQDINMHCCQRLVMNVPMFQDMPVALINSIIFSLKQVLYMPGQTVVEYNKPGESIHLISSGTVAVMDATGREVAHLRDGAFFGENSLLSPGVLRTVSIIALEITEIYILESRDFLSCLQPYPHLKRRMEDVTSARRTTLQARPH